LALKFLGDGLQDHPPFRRGNRVFKKREGANVEPIRVLLVDDQQLFRETLGMVLEIRNPNIKVVAQAANGEEGWNFAVKYQPDVVLMDVRMPVMDGVESARLVREKCPQCRIVMLTTFNDDEYVFQALKLGAAGYLLKDMPSSEVEMAILTVYHGGVLMAPNVAEKVVKRLSCYQNPDETFRLTAQVRESLTVREYEVLELIALGFDNKEIAEKLFLSEGTVRNHASNVYAKLNLRDRAQAIKFALEHKII
jgi:DNA-binding NarL/FixJ family response regulator